MHHRLSGHGFGWTPRVGDGQGGLVPAVHGVAKSGKRLSDWTELNCLASEPTNCHFSEIRTEINITLDIYESYTNSTFCLSDVSE